VSDISAMKLRICHSDLTRAAASVSMTWLSRPLSTPPTVRASGEATKLLSPMPLAYRANSNVFTQTPGEPVACRIWGRMRWVAGELSRRASHCGLSDTPGCANS
jgi:hypothetical protein